MPHTMWFQPKPAGMKRILFHAINHTGLGHLNRAIAVAQLLKAHLPYVQVLFLIEGGEDFIEPTGFPWIMVPGHNQTSEAENIEYITRTTIEVYRPDLTVYETVLLESIHTPIKEAGIREVLMGNMGSLLRNQIRDLSAPGSELDLLLVLQQREDLTPDDQALIDQYGGKKVCVGPLVRMKDQFARESLRRKLGLAEENKVILLTFGGGGYDMARQLLTSALSTRKAILAQCPDARLVVVTGPYFAGELPEKDEFISYASRFEPFLTDFIDISSAIVCMAGYNTVNEIAVSGIPAVCVPTTEADDQIGPGSIAEYTRNFPNMMVGTTDSNALARQVLEALSRERDVTVTRSYWQKANEASQVIMGELRKLLGVSL